MVDDITILTTGGWASTFAVAACAVGRFGAVVPRDVADPNRPMMTGIAP